MCLSIASSDQWHLLVMVRGTTSTSLHAFADSCRQLQVCEESSCQSFALFPWCLVGSLCVPMPVLSASASLVPVELLASLNLN